MSRSRPDPELASFLTTTLVRRPGGRAKPRARSPVDVDLTEARLARATAGPTFAWVGSVALHVAVLGVAAVFVARLASPAVPAPGSSKARSAPPEVGLPTMMVDLSDLAPVRAPTPELAPRPVAGGAELPPRPDTPSSGRGGTAESSPAWNLADTHDGVTLTRDQQSRLDRSQIQRTRDDDLRTSTDRRLALTDPMELTFVVFGRGAAHEARAFAEVDPAHGAKSAASEASARGSAAHPRATPGEGDEEQGAAEHAGAAVASPGLGVLTPTSGRARVASADAASQRPQVTEGRASNPSALSHKTRDNADAPQEVAGTTASPLNASAAGGPTGVGPGGERKDLPTPGSGGAADGGTKSSPNGHGGPGAPDPDPRDARLSDYRRKVTAKIDPLWGDAFPRWAALEGRQGRAIIQFTIRRDGTIDGATIVRSSGIAEFDENVRRAVVRAAPFPPLPEKLGATLPFFLHFDSPNPAVR